MESTTNEKNERIITFTPDELERYWQLEAAKLIAALFNHRMDNIIKKLRHDVLRDKRFTIESAWQKYSNAVEHGLAFLPIKISDIRIMTEQELIAEIYGSPTKIKTERC